MERMKMEIGISYEIPVSEEEFRRIVDGDDADVLVTVLDRTFSNHEDYEVRVTDWDRNLKTITVQAERVE